MVADEIEAVGCDLANMEDKFETNFPVDDEAVKDTDIYKEALSDITEVKERFNELNRILDKFNEVEL